MVNDTFIKMGDKVLITKKKDTFYQCVGRIMSRLPNGNFRVDLKYIIREYAPEDIKALKEGKRL